MKKKDKQDLKDFIEFMRVLNKIQEIRIKQNELKQLLRKRDEEDK